MIMTIAAALVAAACGFDLSRRLYQYVVHGIPEKNVIAHSVVWVLYTLVIVLLIGGVLI